MKCEMCHESILKGNGYYYTPDGPICTQCYCYSGSGVQMADTREQPQNYPGVSECGLANCPVANFQFSVSKAGL